MKKGCLRCVHYFSTFDPTKPRGCKLYGMKSQAFPSVLVKKETGQECMGFKEKNPSKKEKKINLNDPKYW